METLQASELKERSGQGQEVYVGSMEKSRDEKFDRIDPWISPDGDIIDLGAGGGALTDKFAAKYPERHVIAADLSKDMVTRLSARFSGRPNIEVVQSDIKDFKWDRPFGTVLCVSVNHEVFSFNGYKHEAVVGMLKNLYDNPNFKKGGRLIIRDGVEPEPEEMFVHPLNDFALERFGLFIKGFSQVRNVDFEIGRIDPSTLRFRQGGRMEQMLGSGMVFKMDSRDVNEMLSKYWYEKRNLPVELKEQFGIWTLEGYKEALEKIGFKVVHAESYLLPYLLNEHYARDFTVFHKAGPVISNAPYPKSTGLWVAQK